MDETAVCDNERRIFCAVGPAGILGGDGQDSLAYRQGLLCNGRGITAVTSLCCGDSRRTGPDDSYCYTTYGGNGRVGTGEGHRVARGAAAVYKLESGISVCLSGQWAEINELVGDADRQGSVDKEKGIVFGRQRTFICTDDVTSHRAVACCDCSECRYSGENFRCFAFDKSAISGGEDRICRAVRTTNILSGDRQLCPVHRQYLLCG